MTNRTQTNNHHFVILAAHILTVSPEYIASHISNHNALRKTLEPLISPPRPQEQEVINLRYGLRDSQ